jgi:hypothetical protein
LKRNESLFRRTNRNFLHFLRSASIALLALALVVTPTFLGGWLFGLPGALVGSLVALFVFVYFILLSSEHDQMEHERRQQKKLTDYAQYID